MPLNVHGVSHHHKLGAELLVRDLAVVVLVKSFDKLFPNCGDVSLLPLAEQHYVINIKGPAAVGVEAVPQLFLRGSGAHALCACVRACVRVGQETGQRKADEPTGTNQEPTKLSPEEARSPKEEDATIPIAEEGPQMTLVEEPPPPPARSWFGRAEPEPESEEAERPPAPARSWFGRAGPEPEPEEPPLSPFSALRAERERELETLASP